MARLIPKYGVEEIELKPERDVARSLIDQLPDNCIVYHSYPWLREDRNDNSTFLKEGEADFVIVVPEIGILIMEVKGGEIHYDHLNHLWYRQIQSGERRRIKDPFKQASKNMHVIEQAIARKSFLDRQNVPCAYGYAVVFPDCTFSGSMPPGADPSTLLSSIDLPYLGKRVQKILRKWSRHKLLQNLSKATLEGIHEGLSPIFHLKPTLLRRIEDQEKRLLKLTHEQSRVFDFLEYHNRLVVEGVAGSGKTFLAMAQAQRLADQGKKTLFLCYNRYLADWLNSEVQYIYQDKITVTNFHRLCSKYCKDTWPSGAENSLQDDFFWKIKAPDLLLDAVGCDLPSDKFDAIIVDEAQDFFPNWWVPIEMLMKDEDAHLFIFYDPAQNLFAVDPFTIPGLNRPIKLSKNCRNTKKIASVCGKVMRIDMPVKENAPEGHEADVEVAETEEEQRSVIQKYIHKWVGAWKLNPSQICIQSPKTLRKSSISNQSSIGSIAISEDLQVWKRGEAILFTTIRKFKGLESDASMIIDVPKPDSNSHFTKSDFYVACSRAKHLLAIFPLSKDVMNFNDEVMTSTQMVSEDHFGPPSGIG